MRSVALTPRRRYQKSGQHWCDIQGLGFTVLRTSSEIIFHFNCRIALWNDQSCVFCCMSGGITFFLSNVATQDLLDVVKLAWPKPLRLKNIMKP